jgi:hypothetical protein
MLAAIPIPMLKSGHLHKYQLALQKAVKGICILNVESMK